MDMDDGNSDNKTISVQLGWDLTELGKKKDSQNYEEGQKKIKFLLNLCELGSEGWRDFSKY